MRIVTYTELYQKDQTGKVRYWYMQRDLDQPGSYRSVSGIVGREDTSQQVSEWSFASPKNVGKVNGTTADEQAVVVINSTYRIRNEQGYAADLRDAGKKFFQPMLAAKYFALNEKKRAELFKNHDVTVQPKLDGCLSGDTVVVTDEGNFTMRDVVENNKGTKVLSYNLKTKTTEFREIQGRFKNAVDVREKQPHRWFRLTLSDGTEIKLTGNHRVYLPKLRCWRRVDELDGTEELLKFLSV